MANPHLQKLLKKEMTRKEFLVLGGLLVGSVFGITGIIKELMSHAAGVSASGEPEIGTVTSPASIVTDSTASGGKAVKFGSATTPPPPPPPPPGSVTMGVSKADDLHDGYPSWDAVRVYQFGSVAKPISNGAKIICLTDSGISTTGGQSAANQLDTSLASFFKSYPNVEVHWGSGNEIDAHVTTSNVAAYITTLKAMRTVIDKYQAQGRKVSMWIDLTQNHIRTSSDYEAWLMQDAAPLLDGMACSMYPPGTDLADFPAFLDGIFATAKHWGLKRLDCWEGGAKIEPTTTTTSMALTDVNGTKTTYKVSSYKQIRPLWAAYYAKYMVDSGAKNGISVEALCWWDNDTPGRETAFSHDPTGTSPRTVEVWRDWQSWIGKAQ
jgi:hypothetical protein